MEQIKLDVTQGVYKTAKEARNANHIPMIYYGKDVKPENFSADYQDFRRVYEKAGRSTIITMVNEKNQQFPVLVQEIQYHPVTDKIIHVDLKAIDLNKPITAKIPLVFIGQSLAVKDEGGVLVASKDTVTVECLPKDLIHQIEVDISPLVDFHAVIKVADLKVPDNIKILDAKNINVATVAAPRMEEEVVGTPVVAEGAVAAEGEEAAGEEKAEGGEQPAKEEKKEKKGKGKE
jgi:large subunit ribosomal protein L25